MMDNTMIEIMIERWTNAEGETDFRWSVWSDGHRIQMGPSLYSTAEDCEAQALKFCWSENPAASVDYFCTAAYTRSQT